MRMVAKRKVLKRADGGRMYRSTGTAKSQMVPPLGTIWTANKKFGGAVLGSGLEGGGTVFGFGH